MCCSETPDEVAARWRRENEAAGRLDQRGATLLPPDVMDQRTAASIRAQRKAAEILGGITAETWEEAFLGDVYNLHMEVVVCHPRWGIWWKDGFDEHPDATIILGYDLEGQTCIGWTTVGELRKEPIDPHAPHPNRHMPVARLREPWFGDPNEIGRMFW